MDWKCSYGSCGIFAAPDNEMKSLLNEMQDDEKNIEDAFYKNLEFGTGGIRGEIGAGTNRMNLKAPGRFKGY
ncbi:hypothetical protein [Peribacillus sp. V2I11]|uniref:hypothetical protein n=1 Tax=Peribacillus sp. V2I11 TaxID=3042277 RepID=UPI00277D820E|nr:hypothetical protein [Peribacillus sp. V2I11]MDQ0881994.1 hypothetical protein [Peribacillus sp. V2I11]